MSSGRYSRVAAVRVDNVSPSLSALAVAYALEDGFDEPTRLASFLPPAVPTVPAPGSKSVPTLPAPANMSVPTVPAPALEGAK